MSAIDENKINHGAQRFLVAEQIFWILVVFLMLQFLAAGPQEEVWLQALHHWQESGGVLHAETTLLVEAAGRQLKEENYLCTSKVAFWYKEVELKKQKEYWQK